MTSPSWLRRGAPGRHTSPGLRLAWPRTGVQARHAEPVARHARPMPRHARPAAPAAGRAPVARLWRGPRSRFATTTAALLAVATIGWGTADAAFLATASSGSNSWATGTVTFGANSPATALFTVTGAIPGSTGSSCVKLTYTGSLAAQVRLFVASGGLTGTGLGSYLTLQINEGSGNNADCSDFVQSANAYNPTGTSDSTKTLAAFAGASTNHATGVSAWNNVATNATRTYQFVYFLQGDNAAVSKTANATFTWEARS